LLGEAWTVINPLAMIIVYTLIFSQIMHTKLNGIDSDFAYSIYLCAGILTWGFFAEIVGRSLNIFIENANLLKKINFPRICLPVVLVINASINFAIIFGLFLIFLLLSSMWPGWVVLATLAVVVIQLVLAIGLGMVLGVLNVFFRDVGQFFNIFLQFWFWFTPVVYPSSILPESIKSFLIFNPMSSLINAYQGIYVDRQWPDWSSLIYPLVLGTVLCILGMHLYREHVGEMVDEL
jgi:lipopolysaccharide transport system permease protein